MNELRQPAGWYRARRGEGYWSVAKSLGYTDDPLKTQVALRIQNANSGSPIWEDGWVLIPDDLPSPPSPPVALTLDRYADHLRALADDLLAAHAPTPEQRVAIRAQTDKVWADLDRVLAALTAAGIDPSTIDLDAGFDPAASFVDVDGPQNIEPGTVLINRRFNGVVQHRGTEGSAPVVYVNCEHVGVYGPTGGVGGTDCFKLYDADAPAIIVNTLIRPAFPDYRINAVRGHHISAFNLKVRDCVDGLWPMNTLAGKRRADFFMYRADVADLAFFAPIPNRPEGNHSDCIQWPFSAGVFLIESRFSANKNPNVGQGGIVDLSKNWRPAGNACFQLGAGLKTTTDPCEDWFSMACEWTSGTSGWNLSSNRPMDPPVVSFGDVWDGTAEVGDLLIPAHLRDHVLLVGASRLDGQPLNIRYWN